MALMGICLMWMETAPDVMSAAEPASSPEFQVKAVFLFNFAQFVEWPAGAFENEQSPLVIGVLGSDPFGSFLDDVIQGESVNGRVLTVKRYRKIEDVEHCQVLFVSGSEGSHAAKIARTLRGRPILTVCDWEGLARQGAIIRFLAEDDHVRLQINLDAAKAAGLTISSKLLRSAEIVGAQKG
jgi:hypothetical protein